MAADQIRSVGILGMGTMGAGIAHVCATAGLDVVVLEADEARIAAGTAAMREFLEEGVRRGKVEPEGRDEVLGRVKGTTDLADLASVQLLIEAVSEVKDLKLDLLARAAEVVGPDAIITTNTSAIPIAELSVAVPDPSRFAGLHFFNPAPLMPLVEVVCGLDTDAATRQALVDLVGGFGKVAITPKDRPGFLLNRLLMPYLNQALQDYDDGLADADDLDAAVELGLGHPMGPLAMLDLIGLDTHLHATSSAWEQNRDPHLVPPPLLQRLVATGRLGRKSGAGIRSYS